MKFPDYRVTRIDNNTWHIADQINAYMYLAEGNDRAALIDTGFGMYKLRPLIESLTDKPVIIINTHAHLDHFGANFEFDEIYISSHDLEELRQPKIVYTPEQLLGAAKGIFGENAPDELPSPDERGTPGKGVVTAIDEGHVFDLGGRQLEVIAVPAHTPGCICLLDREKRYLYTGDTCCDTYGILMGFHSIKMKVFAEGLEKLISRRAKFDMLYPSHHNWPLPPDILDEFLALAGRITDGSAEFQSDAEGNHRAVYGRAVINFTARNL